MSDSVRPHRRQPTRPRRPWDSPGKNTGVGCHFLLPCMKVKSVSEVAQSCPTLSDPMDCSLPGSSVWGIFQARVLEWGAIAFSNTYTRKVLIEGVKWPNLNDLHFPASERLSCLVLSHMSFCIQPQNPVLSTCAASFSFVPSSPSHSQPTALFLPLYLLFPCLTELPASGPNSFLSVPPSS